MRRIILSIIPFTFLPLCMNAQLSASISDSSNISCFGAADGTATVVVSGGTPPYEIRWNDDSLTAETKVNNLQPDRWYRVRVHDALDSVAADSVRLTQPEAILYELEGLHSIDCYGPEEGYLKILSGGGLGPHTYSWTGEIVSTSDSISNLTTGSYYFEIIDSTGCAVNDSLVLEEADRVQIRFDTLIPNPCLGQQLGEIYVSAEGGAPPYTYAWTGPEEYSSQDQDITGLKEGMYCLDLTDSRGCVYERDTSIVDGDPISVSYSVPLNGNYNLICYGDSSGSIRVDTVAGNGMNWRNYTYIWNGPNGFKAYEPGVENLVAGNYHLNVFDSVNCRSDVTITLTEPPPIFIKFDSIITNPCINDQKSAIYISALSGTEPFSYSWTGPAGFSSSSDDITGLAKGLYSVTVTGGDGCRSSRDTTLIQVDNIEMEIELSEFGDYNISCHGSDDGFIKILDVPGYDDLSSLIYRTTGPNGFSSPFRFITRGVIAGEYQVTVTDPEGCSGLENVSITEPPAVETGMITGETSFVHDSNYVYTVQDESGSGIYTWFVAGGEIWSGQKTKSVEIEWRSEGRGWVKLVETDENGCTGDTVYLMTSKQFPVSDDLQEEKFLNIYPNPVTSTLNIQGSDLRSGTVEFYSLLGQLAGRMNYSGMLNLESLDKGVYYMKIIDRNGDLVLTRKIIKK